MADPLPPIPLGRFGPTLARITERLPLVETALSEAEGAIEDLEAAGSALPDWTGIAGAEFQVGTWPGGLRVMKKIIDIGNLPNNTTKTVAHGVESMIQLLDIAGIVNVGGGVLTAWGQPNITGISLGALVWVSQSDSIRVVAQGVNLSAYTGFIILTYTKV